MYLMERSTFIVDRRGLGGRHRHGRHQSTIKVDRYIERTIRVNPAWP